MTTTATTIADRVRELSHVLPETSAPVATYISVVRTGSLLFVSGQISRTDTNSVTGRVGDNLSLDAGKRGAELAAINLLAQLAASTDGTLGAISRIVRLGVFIAASAEFSDHSFVANGASDLIAAVFGEAGRHARTAIGVASLPTGAAVEIDAIVELAS